MRPRGSGPAPSKVPAPASHKIRTLWISKAACTRAEDDVCQISTRKIIPQDLARAQREEQPSALVVKTPVQLGPSGENCSPATFCASHFDSSTCPRLCRSFCGAEKAQSTESELAEKCRPSIGREASRGLDPPSSCPFSLAKTHA